MTTQRNTDQELRKLILFTKDSIEGFNKAAEHVRNTSVELATDFETRSILRQGYSRQLNTSLEDMGKQSVDRSSTERIAHHQLIHVKNMFANSNNNAAVIQEAMRGEIKLVDYMDKTFSDLNKLDVETQRAIRELKHDANDSIQNLKELSASKK